MSETHEPLRDREREKQRERERDRERQREIERETERGRCKVMDVNIPRRLLKHAKYLFPHLPNHVTETTIEIFCRNYHQFTHFVKIPLLQYCFNKRI